ncbi:ChaB family protein [Nocardia cyriacigeorgica]|uniref:ChaB family protein n=1 Tax=Nocardia cyriacigeorgica TaxID=135487 RepID=UPI001893D38C|nr:ChaB family protein [Nocardia cyriacigeorgica]MBF6346930.1 ChaB family protein [Nocardia cyriacigeorgica]
MPKTTARGEAKRSELPSTVQRSSEKAQRTFAKAHDAALEEYGSESRAYRVAYSALKHSYEKVGDHWEPKEHRGPSDQRAESGGPNAKGDTAEGVNANATKKHLINVAGRLEITGRWKMTKSELIDAIEKTNRRETAARRR